jgi:hypothetical protein
MLSREHRITHEVNLAQFSRLVNLPKESIFEKQKAPAGPCEAECKTFDIYERVIVSGS